MDQQPPQKPRRKMDWVGRHVRLTRNHETQGGSMFMAGLVMLVRRNYGGLELEYVQACEQCSMKHRHQIRGVAERDVELLPSDYRPEVETDR